MVYHDHIRDIRTYAKRHYDRFGDPSYTRYLMGIISKYQRINLRHRKMDYGNDLLRQQVSKLWVIWLYE